MVKTVRLIGFWLYLLLCISICLIVSIFCALFIVVCDIIVGRFKDIGSDVIEYYHDYINDMIPVCKAMYKK